MAESAHQGAARVRILHIVPWFHPAVYFGGPTISLYCLCNHLAALPGVELRVMTTDTSGPRRRDRLSTGDRPVRAYPGYQVRFHRKALGAAFAPSLLLSLWKVVAWSDVVHITAVYSSSTVSALLAARILRKPVVWSPRGALQRWSGSRHVLAKRAWDRLCDLMLDPSRSLLHVTSHLEAAESGDRIVNARPVIVENGVETPGALPERNWRSEGCLRLLYMGRLDPKKGIDNLLHALARLRDDSIRLRICGSGTPGYTAYLAGLVRKLGLAGNVDFVGIVTGEAKFAEFLQADVGVMPSHTENFGMAAAEALAHGIPVIAGKGTPWRDLEEHRAGLWVANDPQGLADAILRMRHSDIAVMGTAGREWMLRSYGWPRIAERMLDVYKELCGIGKESHASEE